MKGQQVINNIMGHTVELLLNTVDWLRSLVMPMLVCILSLLTVSMTTRGVRRWALSMGVP